MATYIKISEMTAASILDGTEALAVVQTTTKKTTVRDVRNAEPVAKSTDYTILDADADVFDVTTGASDRTLTLPTLADNQGRVIEIHKVDNGAGKTILDGEGAETIEGATTFQLPTQYNMVKVRGGASTWLVVEMRAGYDTGWVANSDWTNALLAVTHNLATDATDLIVKFFIAETSDGSDAFDIFDTAFDVSSTADRNRGVQLEATGNDNAFNIRTGTNGLHYLNDGVSLPSLLSTQSWYYKVVVYRLK